MSQRIQFSEQLIQLQIECRKLRCELDQSQLITGNAVDILEKIADLVERLPEDERVMLKTQMSAFAHLPL